MVRFGNRHLLLDGERGVLTGIAKLIMVRLPPDWAYPARREEIIRKEMITRNSCFASKTVAATGIESCNQPNFT